MAESQRVLSWSEGLQQHLSRLRSGRSPESSHHLETPGWSHAGEWRFRSQADPIPEVQGPLELEFHGLWKIACQIQNLDDSEGMPSD